MPSTASPEPAAPAAACPTPITATASNSAAPAADGATVYYYDGIRPIWEADGAGTPRVQLDRDIFGNLLGRREVSSGVRRYFAHDGLGGLIGVTDEGGTQRGEHLLRRLGQRARNIMARELARAIEPTVGRDMAYNIAGRILDSIAGRASLDQAFVEVAATKPTRDQIRNLYYAGCSRICVGFAASGTLRLKYGDPEAQHRIAVGVAMIILGGELIIPANQDDLLYYGGEVLETLDPATRAFLRFFLR